MVGARLELRTEENRLDGKLLFAAAGAAALAVAGVVVLLAGHNPLKVFSQLVSGSLGTAFRFRSTVHIMIPLYVLALGTAAAFNMRFWNIGQEGQFYMGAFGASFAAFSFPGLPAPLLLPLMFFAGFVCGGLWALIPALLKLRFSANEMLVTLMLNYIAVCWVSYLQFSAWRDPLAFGFPKIALFDMNAVLPRLFGIHVGWVVALCLTVFMYVLFKRTKLGYEIEITRKNQVAARYVGMNMFKITVFSVLLSGGLCGAAGMMQASAVEQTLSMNLSNGYGFIAILIAWIARLKLGRIFIISFLFAALMQGSNFLQNSMQISASLSMILQGIIVFFALGSKFFARYRLVRKTDD